MLTTNRKVQREKQVSLSKKLLDRYNEGYNIYRSYVNSDNWSLFKAIENVDRDKIFGDFGCLDGSVAYMFSKMCKESYGFDLTEITQDITFKYPNLEYIGIDLDEAFPEKIVFDTILIIDVLEHLYFDKKFLEQCYESLHKNGRMILSVPIMEAIDGTFFRLYTVSDIRKRVAGTGFTIIDEYVDRSDTNTQIHLILRKQ